MLSWSTWRSGCTSIKNLQHSSLWCRRFRSSCCWDWGLVQTSPWRKGPNYQTAERQRENWWFHNAIYVCDSVRFGLNCILGHFNLHGGSWLAFSHIRGGKSLFVELRWHAPQSKSDHFGGFVPFVRRWRAYWKIILFLKIVFLNHGYLWMFYIDLYIHDFSFFWDSHRCRVLQKILCVHPQWLKSVNDWRGIRKQLVQQKYGKWKARQNPTCQLLPKSSQRKVKMGWERQEREKRWWRIGVCKKCMSCRSEVCERVEFRVKVLLVKEVCVKAWCVKVVCVWTVKESCVKVLCVKELCGRTVWDRSGCKSVVCTSVAWEVKVHVAKGVPCQMTLDVGKLPHKVKVDVAKCHACHTKCRSMSPRATPATQTAAATTAPNGTLARH